MVWNIAAQKNEIIDSPVKLKEQLLLNRGLLDLSEIELFFDPKLASYESEFELTGIHEAKKRILEAIKNDELIMVYGDYDVDGVCSVAILYHTLTSLGAKVLPYIPHREREGYGLSTMGLDRCSEKGAKVVITVDNGIVAFEEAEYAKGRGIDLIITDHHVPTDKKPSAFSIIHSTKMCGAGVAWCLARKLVEGKFALSLLDLVAVATVCDLIELLGVNRSLVKEGVERLNRTDRVGFLALFKECGIDFGGLTTYQIGHMIGPRLNAMGRMEDAIDSLRLLCTQDADKAIRLAKLLCQTNDQKKKITADAINEARLIIETGKIAGSLDEKILIVHSANWIPGIIGLVAGRLSEEYKLPTIAIASNGIHSKGSARSVNGVNIIESIRLCADLLMDVGGHPQAAGFTMETTKIDLFKDGMRKVMEEVVVEKQFMLEVEGLVDGKSISKSWLAELDKFEPFGIGNPRPVLASQGVRVSDIRTVGEGKHLKFKAEGVDAIAFSFGYLSSTLKEGQFVDLAFTPELNKYNGMENLQFKIIDLQTSAI